MANKIKRMDEIKRILEEYQKTGSIKSTSRRLGVSKNTIRRYLRQAENQEKGLGDLLEQSVPELEKVFYEQQRKDELRREEVFNQKVSYWLEELKRVGVTRQLLWEEYRLEQTGGYGYSQFCDRLKRHISSKDLTMAMSHRPGEKLMLDFAGKKIPWHDEESGKICWAEVLIGVLPHSHYTYAIALPNQKTESFLEGVSKSLEYLGGVPQYLLSDNLKAYVIRADRYEPDYNELAAQLASHYDIDLQSTRSRKPKDKGSVENMVSTVYTRLYAPLRNTTFYSIDQINQSLLKQLEEHNEKPYQQRQGNRKLVFEKDERPLLKALPVDRFEIKKTTRAKIQNNYHAFLGEDKNYYSVPYAYVGQLVEVVYTERIVEIYLKGRRIAIHERIPKRETYKYATEESHKPEAHRIYDELRNYNDTDFIKQATKVGQSTHWAINHILTYQPNKDQSYKSCLGIIRLGSSYGYMRLEKACQKCQEIGQVNYKMLRNILEKKLEESKDTYTTSPTLNHENIRGPQSYN